MVRLARLGLLVPVFALLHLHFHHDFHGSSVDYWGVALAAAASWVGVPGPGEPVLIAAAVLAAQHRLDIGGVIVVAWAAATLGGIVGWMIGLKAGRNLLTGRGPLRSLRVAAVARGERVFERYPVTAIILSPSWIAGIHGVRSRVYQPVNALSAALWAGGIGLGAYLIGPTVLDFVSDLGLVTGTVVVLVLVGCLLFEIRRRRRRSARRTGANEPPPSATARSRSS